MRLNLEQLEIRLALSAEIVGDTLVIHGEAASSSVGDFTQIKAITQNSVYLIQNMTGVVLTGHVTKIKYIGTDEADRYINLTNTNQIVFEDVEGNAGNDLLSSGINQFALMHGGDGDDRVICRAHDGEIWGDDGSDFLILGFNNGIVHKDATDRYAAGGTIV